MRVLATLALLAACSVPDSRFGATPDAADDPGARVLAIVAAPSALDIDEGASRDLAVRLSQPPSSPLTVSIAVDQPDKVALAVPSLTFTPDNFDQPQPVAIAGLDDSDTTDVHAELTLTALGVDPLRVATTVHDAAQVIQLSATQLVVTEGTTGTFTVSLKYDPGATVTVALANSNAAALPLDTSSITFASGNYDTPVTVKVSPPIDANHLAEVATVTASGAGAPSAATIALDVADETVLQTWGWPMPFPSTSTVSAGFAVAYKINLGNAASLDAFHTYVPTASGKFRMALYADANDAPGALVAEMGAGKAMVNGVNDGAALANTALAASSYFLVVRFDSDVNIGYAAAGVTGRQCFRNVPYATIDTPWATTFGASSCTTDRLYNLWISTYHQ